MIDPKFLTFFAAPILVCSYYLIARGSFSERKVGFVLGVLASGVLVLYAMFLQDIFYLFIQVFFFIVNVYSALVPINSEKTG